MNDVQKNAIREADNYLKAAGLPTYNALTQRPAAQTEREAFEAWWKGDLVDWRGHASVPAEHAWAAWQARASLPAPQRATPEPLIVKGAMAGMVDAQVRDLWPTKGAALAAAQAKGGE